MMLGDFSSGRGWSIKGIDWSMQQRKMWKGTRIHKVGRCHGDEFENVHIHVASDCKVMDKWLFSSPTFQT